MKRFSLGIRMLLVLWGTIMALHSAATAQISNGGFEIRNASQCPAGQDELYKSANWFKTTQGTSDYWNSCDNANCFGPAYICAGVPNNQFGNQPDHTGSSPDGAYAGIVIQQSTSNVAIREYISQQLSTALLSGRKYKVTFYVSRSERVYTNLTSGTRPDAISNIRAEFTSGSPYNGSTNGVLPASTVYSQITTGPYTSVTNWMKVEGIFQVPSGVQYNYITIGNFQNTIPASEIKKWDNVNNIDYTPVSGPYEINSYYYIDDVSITPVCECDSDYGVIIQPAEESESGKCCFDYKIFKTRESACDLYAYFVDTPPGSNGAIAGSGGSSPLLVTVSDTIRGQICIPAFTGTQNIQVKLWNTPDSDPLTMIENCSKTLTIQGCPACNCEEDFSLLLTPQVSTNPQECCFDVKLVQKESSQCDLYGYSLQVNGAGVVIGSWSNLNPLNGSSNTINAGTICIPKTGGPHNIVLKLWTGTPVADPENRPEDCTVSVAAPACELTCCDRVHITATPIVSNSSPTPCCYSITITQDQPVVAPCEPVAGYVEIEDLNSGLMTFYYNGAAPFTTTQCFTKDAQGNVRIRVTTSTASGAIYCEKILAGKCNEPLVEVPANCCDNITAQLRYAYGPLNGQCCWDLDLFQSVEPGCEIYEVKVYDSYIFLPYASTSSSTPININGTTIRLCKGVNTAAAGSFKVEFYGKDANGNSVLLCTKTLSYNCGTPTPCCDNLNAWLSPPVSSPQDKCCWDLRITQNSPANCDIYGIKVYDGMTLIKNQSGSSPMSLIDPSPYPVPVFLTFCKLIPSNGSVSGTITVEFYGKDANGNNIVVCTKTIPYSCGGGGPIGGGPAKAGSGNDISATSAHQLSLHPNPSVDEVTISFYLEEQTDVTIEIYNLLGESVDLIPAGATQKGMNSVRYASSKLQNGSYIVRLLVNGKTFSIPMTVSR